MKYVITWVVGGVLLTPIIVSLFSNSLIAVLIGIAWGLVLYLSSKTKFGHLFWRNYWKANVKINLALEYYGKK